MQLCPSRVNVSLSLDYVYEEKLTFWITVVNYGLPLSLSLSRCMNISKSILTLDDPNKTQKVSSGILRYRRYHGRAINR